MILKNVDLDLLQTAAQDGLSSLIQGLIAPNTQCIITGLAITITQVDNKISITEGMIFIEDEVFYVPASQFTYLDNGNLYFTQNFTTTENREFHDMSTHDIYDIRNYALGYGDGALPSGSINIMDLPRLSQIQLETILAQITLQADFTGYDRVYYQTGFAPATGYGSMRLEKNAFGFILLLGAFNASTPAGKLGVVPVGSRPTGDFIGYFFNWSVAPGVLKIKKNGEIWVSGADMNNTNYVSMVFPITFEDPVNWGLPTGGGGTAKGADQDYIPGGTLNRQDFTSGPNQTTFIVTNFHLNDNYIFLIGGIVQIGSARVGDMVTYSAGVAEGTLVTILN